MRDVPAISSDPARANLMPHSLVVPSRIGATFGDDTLIAAHPAATSRSQMDRKRPKCVRLRPRFGHSSPLRQSTKAFRRDFRGPHLGDLNVTGRRPQSSHNVAIITAMKREPECIA